MYNECRHIFTSGKKCQSPALNGRELLLLPATPATAQRETSEAYEPESPRRPSSTTCPRSKTPTPSNSPSLTSSSPWPPTASTPRRAQILIYGLQVASQNHRHRAAQAAKEEVPAQTVREIHEHEDGTPIGPAQQSPDPEEIEEQRRPPSLGEILLREAEALTAQREEREARQKAEAEEAAKSAEHTRTFQLPHIGLEIKAVAEEPPAKSCRSLTPGKRRVSNISQRCAGQRLATPQRCLDRLPFAVSFPR